MTNLEKIKKLNELQAAIEFKQKTLSHIVEFKYLEIVLNEDKKYDYKESICIDKSNSNNFLSIIQELGTKLLNEEIKELEKEIESIFKQMGE
jgi:hypothetical protein